MGLRNKEKSALKFHGFQLNGESDTTSGLASNPTVGNLMEKLEPYGVHLCFGETSELTELKQFVQLGELRQKLKKNSRKPGVHTMILF